MFNFIRSCQTLFQSVVGTILHPHQQCMRESQGSTSSPELGIVSIFYFGYACRREVASHRGFNLFFPIG